MQIASLFVHPWKFIGRKSKVQLSMIVCFTGTALQVSSSATPWLIAKFTMMKVCLCTSRPAMKRLDSLTRGWIWWRELWEKGDERRGRMPADAAARAQNIQTKSTHSRESLQQVKACTQSVFVSASHLHIKTPGVLVLSLLLLLPLWSTSPSFSPPWLFS